MLVNLDRDAARSKTRLTSHWVSPLQLVYEFHRAIALVLKHQYEILAITQSQGTVIGRRCATTIVAYAAALCVFHVCRMQLRICSQEHRYSGLRLSRSVDNIRPVSAYR